MIPPPKIYGKSISKIPHAGVGVRVLNCVIHTSTRIIALLVDESKHYIVEHINLMQMKTYIFNVHLFYGMSVEAVKAIDFSVAKQIVVAKHSLDPWDAIDDEDLSLVGTCDNFLEIATGDDLPEGKVICLGWYQE